MIVARRLLAILLVSAPLMGCRAIDIHFDDRQPVQTVQTVWEVELDPIEPFAYNPRQTAVPAYGARGRVVVAGSDAGEIVAANARTGQVLWRFDARGKVRGGLAVVGNAVYTGSTDGKLYRLDLRSGAEDWEKPYSTQGAITASPAVAGDRVVFQNNRNRTYAVDAKTGAYVWDQGRPRPEFLTIKGDGGPTISGDKVYAGYDDGFVAAIRLADGATVWSRDLSGEERQFVDVDTRPVVYRDLVFAGSFATGLYALSARHGNIKWFHRGRGIRTPAMGERYLFAAMGSGRIDALDPHTGKAMWSVRLDYGELSAPTVQGDYLWAPTGDGLVLIDGERASVLARISPDHGQTASVVSNGSWVHMVTNSGALVGARLLL